MTKPTVYLAVLDGVVIGQRKSPRVYSHVVVGQRDEAAAKHRAYNYQSDSADRSNFEYYSRVAACEPLSDEAYFDLARAGKLAGNQYRTKEVNAARAQIAGGFDAYVARLRDFHIANFEDLKAKGGFKMGALTWCGRRDLADKAIGQFHHINKQILPVVVKGA